MQSYNRANYTFKETKLIFSYISMICDKSVTKPSNKVIKDL